MSVICSKLKDESLGEVIVTSVFLLYGLIFMPCSIVLSQGSIDKSFRTNLQSAIGVAFEGQYLRHPDGAYDAYPRGSFSARSYNLIAGRVQLDIDAAYQTSFSGYNVKGPEGEIYGQYIISVATGYAFTWITTDKYFSPDKLISGVPVEGGILQTWSGRYVFYKKVRAIGFLGGLVLLRRGYNIGVVESVSPAIGFKYYSSSVDSKKIIHSGFDVKLMFMKSGLGYDVGVYGAGAVFSPLGVRLGVMGYPNYWSKDRNDTRWYLEVYYPLLL